MLTTVMHLERSGRNLVRGGFLAKLHLAETVYGDMSVAEKIEFPEFHDAFSKRKTIPQRVADWRLLHGTEVVEKDAAEEGATI